MLDNFDEKVNRMPRPEIINVPNSISITFTTNEKVPISLTTNWQWVLAKISRALIARQSREIINLLVAELDCVQLTNNATNDIQHLIRQPIDLNAWSQTQAKIQLFKNLVNEYISYPQANHPPIDRLIKESNLVINQIQSLGVTGIGAFMIASCLQLAVLQEQAKLDVKYWSNVKAKALNYSNYVAISTPKMFQLSVGLIDKICHCVKWETRTEAAETITEYECRYFDGKDLHVFREFSPNAIKACSKHRLQMFKTVTDKVNYTAVRPIREAKKRWQELAESI